MIQAVDNTAKMSQKSMAASKGNKALPPLPNYRLRCVAASMAFFCFFSFTDWPLAAQTYDAHRKRADGEARILKRRLNSDFRGWVHRHIV